MKRWWRWGASSVGGGGNKKFFWWSRRARSEVLRTDQALLSSQESAPKFEFSRQLISNSNFFSYSSNCGILHYSRPEVSVWNKLDYIMDQHSSTNSACWKVVPYPDETRNLPPFPEHLLTMEDIHKSHLHASPPFGGGSKLAAPFFRFSNPN